MGAVHTAVSGVLVLHAAADLARPLHQVGPEHCQSGAGGPLLPELREVSRPRQNHAVHDQVNRPVLLHAPQTQGRHIEKVRVRHTAAVLHGRLMLLLLGLLQRQHGRLVGAGRRHRRHLPGRALLFHQDPLPLQLARPAVPTQHTARPQELSPLRHRDHTEHYAGQGRLRLGLLPARHHVRLQGQGRGPSAHVHGAVRAAHQSIQRKSLHVRVVLARVRLVC